MNVGSQDEKVYENKHIKYKRDKDAVSKLLKDPIYARVLKYGDVLCDLGRFYDFEPAVSVEDFFKINKISSFESTKLVSSIMANKKKDEVKADLLRGMLFFRFCNKSFSSGLTSKDFAADKTTGKKSFYYIYKCETNGCEFKNKSVRSSKILTCAYVVLDRYQLTTEENYAHYLADVKAKIDAGAKKMRSELTSLTKRTGEKKNELKQTK